MPGSSRSSVSPALLQELERQSRALASSPARERHLRALSEPNAGVVVTGQQVGLFLGPAYTVYKAATAVALARRLGEREGRPVVPVFWLQSEDHDADEVAWSASLLSDGSRERITLTPSGHPRASMSARALGDGARDALDALSAASADAPHRDETVELFSRHYHPRSGWVEAFGGALGELFAEEGLVVLDPRTPAVAELCRPLHRRALAEAEMVEGAVERGAQALERAGEPVGVRPRPGCSLSFHHPEGPTGPRYRLTRTPAGWTSPGVSEPISTQTLLDELEREPLRFSSSGLFRVILQDALLPVAAQVAGPGEARYLRQMPPLHEVFDLVSPPVVPRASCVVTDARCRRHLSTLGVSAIEVGDRDALLARLASQEEGPRGEEVVDRLRRSSLRELDELGPTLEAIEPSLARAVARTRRHLDKGISRLGQRVDRARARRDGARLERVDHVCRRLRPEGAPQERVLGVPYFAAHHGVAAFKAGIQGAIELHLDAVLRGEPTRALEVAL